MECMQPTLKGAAATFFQHPRPVSDRFFAPIKTDGFTDAMRSALCAMLFLFVKGGSNGKAF
jgi:hypothetical protein